MADDIPERSDGGLYTQIFQHLSHHHRVHFRGYESLPSLVVPQETSYCPEKASIEWPSLRPSPKEPAMLLVAHVNLIQKSQARTYLIFV
jgi:hypothetical protein